MRRDLAATRDLAGALQARLDNTAGQAVSAAADLTAKLAECERKLRDALDEVNVSPLRSLIENVNLC